MVFKILYHFIGDEGILREILWLNKGKDVTKEKLYEWQWSPFGYEPIKLTFKSMSGSTRRFEEGTLTFDHIGGVFTYYGQTFRLKRSK